MQGGMRVCELSAGDVVGLLTLRERVSGPTPHRYWLCDCECGAWKVARENDLRRAAVKSCGCATSRLKSAAKTRHGHCPRGTGRSLTYNSWTGMLARCERPTNKEYARYGAAGVKVCDRWHTFDAFLADMGERPSREHSIDRVDPFGDYTPENCRWATRAEQARNTRRAALQRRAHAAVV